MSGSEESNRAVVTTYVPQYQKREWESHAAELDMSQSEFVKTMVQAGRRGFGDGEERSEGGSSGQNPRGQAGETGQNEDLESTVLRALEEGPPMSWDDLLETVIGDLETELESAITALQEQNEITHNPRKGGYERREG